MRQIQIFLIFVVFVAALAATVDSKTVLYGTQGLHDRTCPEIGKCQKCKRKAPQFVSCRTNRITLGGKP